MDKMMNVRRINMSCIPDLKCRLMTCFCSAPDVCPE